MRVNFGDGDLSIEAQLAKNIQITPDVEVFSDKPQVYWDRNFSPAKPYYLEVVNPFIDGIEFQLRRYIKYYQAQFTLNSVIGRGTVAKHFNMYFKNVDRNYIFALNEPIPLDAFIRDVFVETMWEKCMELTYCRLGGYGFVR